MLVICSVSYIAGLNSIQLHEKLCVILSNPLGCIAINFEDCSLFISALKFHSLRLALMVTSFLTT